MSQRLSQNIFQYATSELSQDAFICLVIAWFDSDDKELQNISCDFVNLLYNEYFESEVVLDIESINIIKQHFKIDVYFEVIEKNGNRIPFIIEDKTWTQPHSKQLQRYADKVAKNTKIEKDKIVKIFFKTGHITEKDIYETKIEKYKIMDIKKIWSFFSKYKTDNIIYNDFVDFIERNYYSEMYYKTNGIKKEIKDWTPEDSKKGFVQYAIIETIKKNLLVKNLANDANKISYTKNGKNWSTWWTFYSEHSQYILFIKIVQISRTYKIRLIEYSKKDTTIEQKENTLSKHIKICNSILNDSAFDSIQCGKLKYMINSGKSKGALVRESEIASMDLNNDLTLIESTRIFSKFLEKFLEYKNNK